MAPTAVNSSSTSVILTPTTDFYTIDPVGVVTRILNSTTQSTTPTTTTVDYDYDYPQPAVVVFWTDYTVYYVILFILVLMLPFLIIMVKYRSIRLEYSLANPFPLHTTIECNASTEAREAAPTGRTEGTR